MTQESTKKLRIGRLGPRGAHLRIDGVEDDPSIALPSAFVTGMRRGWIPEAYARVARTVLVAARREGGDGAFTDMYAVIAAIAEDFVRPSVYGRQASHDGKDELRRNMVAAARRLDQNFVGLLPVSLWETYAYPALMDDPTEPRSILEDAAHLPNAWWMHDILLHAPAKVFSFMLHVQSVFSETAGVVIDHECGCRDCIRPDDGNGPRMFVPPERRAQVAQAVFEHILAEAYLVVRCGMPFSYATERRLLEKAAVA